MGPIKRREFSRALAGLATTGLAGRAFSWEAGGHPDPNPQPTDTITAVPGIRVGHHTETQRPTGCTAILFEEEVTAGVDYDSSTPGSFMGVRLLPASLSANLHGMLLTGGGGFGLGAVAGLMRYLEDRHAITNARGSSAIYLPSVVGASIYDLIVGNPKIRPDANSAYQACEAASSGPVAQGNVGAGAGATVGKMLKGFGGMKGGLGSASLRVGEAVVGALAVVNALGDIIDRHTGNIIAGARSPSGKGFANIVATLKKLPADGHTLSDLVDDPLEQSTTLVVIATNVSFGKPELAKIAAMGATGAARVINPYHSTGDGDSTFAVSTNRIKWETSAAVQVSAPAVSAVGALAAETVSEAITRAIKAANSIEGWPAARNYPRN
jgi:L-aminopeptidase/D-esterase-like protein